MHILEYANAWPLCVSIYVISPKLKQTNTIHLFRLFNLKLLFPNWEICIFDEN